MRRIIKIITLICFLSLSTFSFMCCTQNISGEDAENSMEDNKQIGTEYLSNSKSVYSTTCTSTSSSFSSGKGGM